MIKVKIASPLPNMIGMSDNLGSVNTEFKELQEYTVQGLFNALMDRYPGFSKYVRDNGIYLLNMLLLSVDGDVIEKTDKMKHPLRNGCEVMLFMPYWGG